MSETPEAKRAYAKGYAAGRRRLRAEDEARAIRAMREQFEREVFLVVLPAVMAGNWEASGKPVRTAEDYCRVARDFATRAANRFLFTPPPAPPAEPARPVPTPPKFYRPLAEPGAGHTDREGGE